jgi:hypothetical protein
MIEKRPNSIDNRHGGPNGARPPVRGAEFRREARLIALRNALIVGEQSGPPRPFDNDAFLARMRAKPIP